MMLKLTKEEVERACEHWLRATGHKGYQERETKGSMPVAIHLDHKISCKHTRSGAECQITKIEDGSGS